MCGHNDKVNLRTPIWMKRKRKPTIEVDKCCAVVLRHLWKHKIDTLYHCCKHSVGKPYIILAGEYGRKDIARIKKLISQKDKRKWEIS